MLLGIGLGFLLAIFVVWLTGPEPSGSSFIRSRHRRKLLNLNKLDIKEPEIYKVSEYFNCLNFSALKNLVHWLLWTSKVLICHTLLQYFMEISSCLILAVEVCTIPSYLSQCLIESQNTGFIDLSIIYYFTHRSCARSWCAGAYPSLFWVRGRVHYTLDKTPVYHRANTYRQANSGQSLKFGIMAVTMVELGRILITITPILIG